MGCQPGRPANARGRGGESRCGPPCRARRPISLPVTPSQRLAAEEERRKDETFEKANPGFVAQFKSDMERRRRTEERKAKRVVELKETGNTAYKHGDWFTALNRYAAALALDATNEAVLNNVAAVHLTAMNNAVWKPLPGSVVETLVPAPASTVAAVAVAGVDEDAADEMAARTLFADLPKELLEQVAPYVDHAHHVIDYASRVLALKPDNGKARFRRAQACLALYHLTVGSAACGLPAAMERSPGWVSAVHAPVAEAWLRAIRRYSSFPVLLRRIGLCAAAPRAGVGTDASGGAGVGAAGAADGSGLPAAVLERASVPAPPSEAAADASVVADAWMAWAMDDLTRIVRDDTAGTQTDALTCYATALHGDLALLRRLSMRQAEEGSADLAAPLLAVASAWGLASAADRDRVACRAVYHNATPPLALPSRSGAGAPTPAAEGSRAKALRELTTAVTSSGAAVGAGIRRQIVDTGLLRTLTTAAVVSLQAAVPPAAARSTAGAAAAAVADDAAVRFARYLIDGPPSDSEGGLLGPATLVETLHALAALAAPPPADEVTSEASAALAVVRLQLVSSQLLPTVVDVWVRGLARMRPAKSLACTLLTAAPGGEAARLRWNLLGAAATLIKSLLQPGTTVTSRAVTAAAGAGLIGGTGPAASRWSALTPPLVSRLHLHTTQQVWVSWLAQEAVLPGRETAWSAAGCMELAASTDAAIDELAAFLHRSSTSAAPASSPSVVAEAGGVGGGEASAPPLAAAAMTAAAAELALLQYTWLPTNPPAAVVTQWNAAAIGAAFHLGSGGGSASPVPDRLHRVIQVAATAILPQPTPPAGSSRAVGSSRAGAAASSIDAARLPLVLTGATFAVEAAVGCLVNLAQTEAVRPRFFADGARMLTALQETARLALSHSFADAATVPAKVDDATCHTIAGTALAAIANCLIGQTPAAIDASLTPAFVPAVVAFLVATVTAHPGGIATVPPLTVAVMSRAVLVLSRLSAAPATASNMAAMGIDIWLRLLGYAASLMGADGTTAAPLSEASNRVDILAHTGRIIAGLLEHWAADAGKGRTAITQLSSRGGQRAVAAALDAALTFRKAAGAAVHQRIITALGNLAKVGISIANEGSKPCVGEEGDGSRGDAGSAAAGAGAGAGAASTAIVAAPATAAAGAAAASGIATVASVALRSGLLDQLVGALVLAGSSVDTLPAAALAAKNAAIAVAKLTRDEPAAKQRVRDLRGTEVLLSIQGRLGV